jgi:hypothetical protein
VSTLATNPQQHYFQTSYALFHQTRAANVESMEENVFQPLSKTWLSVQSFAWTSHKLKSVS